MKKNQSDIDKKYFAESFGFSVGELWSSNSVEENIIKAKEFINEKINGRSKT
jgi:hypothetical protein